MAPALLTTLEATADVDCVSYPFPGASQFDPGVVGEIGTPLGGGPFAPMLAAYFAQTAGCSAMQYSSSTKLVPAGSLSVMGSTGRFGSVTLALAPFCFNAGSSQFVICPVRRRHAV